MSAFRVGITRELLGADGRPDLPSVGLDGLAALDGVKWAFLDNLDVVSPTELTGLDALVVEGARVDAHSLEGADDLVLVARYGVGFDSVDVGECTSRGILVTNAPDGSRRPMATVNLALILALTLRLRTKDRLAREGRWDAWRSHMGVGLIGRTLGLIGLGSIGAETLRLTHPLEMRHLVHDPYVSDERVRAAGAEPAPLDTLLREADVVCLAVPLTPSTRHLIGEPELRLMKRTSFLVNTTRGPVVDQVALTRALSERWIEGAGLDVFEQEPPVPDDPLLSLANVILSPHALGVTDECFLLTGRSVVGSIAAVMHGEPPKFVVNRDVLDGQRLQSRLAALRER